MESQDKETKMFSVVEQWNQSGQSQKLFSQQQGLNLATFNYWVKKYKQQHLTNKGFARVELTGRDSVNSSARIEIELADGMIVRIF
ncbi:MAG: hypothetical protein Q8J97_08620 [Flavobacteriaceae bacterium]|nr:hypothetical protein [Flavobacteriaceae bacterium]